MPPRGRTPLKPGDVVGQLTLLQRTAAASKVNGSSWWKVEYRCGEVAEMRSKNIRRRGHCGCKSPPRDVEGEVTRAEIGADLGVSYQVVEQIEHRARRKFARHWTHWRRVYDTDLESATIYQLYSVVLSCRVLLEAMDRREAYERKTTT